ncbi:phage replisome organizer N-terminal domain-containing protein [Enterococcus devriesei]|uniref:phage replisome organizer N-terminal domain-containing protein n=1 Tax=Enterococcus devriesei TaxID=319970 RepID=UPI0028E66273|nr:phage replisome organizer N-terminal domain-containing protein [Enterococcus devriesei]
MGEISWIKLKTTMFDDEKIRLIQAVPESDAILVIWIRLLVLAGKTNDEGLIYIQRNMPYTEEMLATLFDKPVNTVRLALQTLASFNMIDLNNDGVIAIANWGKHQNVEGLEKIREQNRLRAKRHYDKKKEPNVSLTLDVTQPNATDIDKEIDKEKDIKEDSRKSRKRIYEDDSPYFQLAKHLFEKISNNGPIKEPNFQTWADDIRKMVELDGRDIGKVGRMIEWCQKDSFWSSNILSAKKLREKYDVMARQANRKPERGYNKPKGRVEDLPSHIAEPPKNVEISPEKQAELDRKLAEYLNKEEIK